MYTVIPATYPAEPSSGPSVVRGASYSFIASSFAHALGLEVSQLDKPLNVDTPIRVSVILNRVCRGYAITIAGQTLEFDLILLEITGDWSDSLISSFYSVKGRDCRDFFLASLLVDDDNFNGDVYPAVVCDFLDMFPKDLTELPPHIEVEFAIDLMPYTTPIFDVVSL
ncbi:uncharacterized protein LOC132271262 [Cornus florida]|uniref:uncharacterized protein LOC132271262 n=1 Tax=Cornus florida TaxID=4283 RepID=UPI00289EFACE|nr:uncharacterized protein LOC132271262 [Cornus florida]